MGAGGGEARPRHMEPWGTVTPPGRGAPSPEPQLLQPHGLSVSLGLHSSTLTLSPQKGHSLPKTTAEHSGQRAPSGTKPPRGSREEQQPHPHTAAPEGWRRQNPTALGGVSVHPQSTDRAGGTRRGPAQPHGGAAGGRRAFGWGWRDAVSQERNNSQPRSDRPDSKRRDSMPPTPTFHFYKPKREKKTQLCCRFCF